ncbi:MAG: hypothetical protein JWQ90_5170 [Hydrocarboniphaga sp.]|nr:hypothetical protein [Hydrocarboniphaga sp.]MDB5972720.1 hypothetical protein [Hydrocarboniphaga sp.]
MIAPCAGVYGLIMPVLHKLLREITGSAAISAPYGALIVLYALM